MFEEVAHFEWILKGGNSISVTAGPVAPTVLLNLKELCWREITEKIVDRDLSEVRDQHFFEPFPGDFLGRVGKFDPVRLELSEDLSNLWRIVER